MGLGTRDNASVVQIVIEIVEGTRVSRLNAAGPDIKDVVVTDGVCVGATVPRKAFLRAKLRVGLQNGVMNPVLPSYAIGTLIS